jgi:hypothetical protein
VVRLLFDRFQLERWAREPGHVPGKQEADSYPFEPGQYRSLAEDLMSLLILLVTELPLPPGEGGCGGVCWRACSWGGGLWTLGTAVWPL